MQLLFSPSPSRAPLGNALAVRPWSGDAAQLNVALQLGAGVLLGGQLLAREIDEKDR